MHLQRPPSFAPTIQSFWEKVTNMQRRGLSELSSEHLDVGPSCAAMDRFTYHSEHIQTMTSKTCMSGMPDFVCRALPPPWCAKTYELLSQVTDRFQQKPCLRLERELLLCCRWSGRNMSRHQQNPARASCVKFSAFGVRSSNSAPES